MNNLEMEKKSKKNQTLFYQIVRIVEEKTFYDSKQIMNKQEKKNLRKDIKIKDYERQKLQ